MTNRRYKKPWKQPQRVTGGVTSVLKKIGLNSELVALKVREAWDDAVGESIARRSLPTELAKGVLYVTVESPTWQNELRYIEKEILARVNARYRELTPGATDSPVRALRMRTGTVPARKPRPRPKEKAPEPTEDERRAVDARVAELTDPELKTAARRMLLAEVVARRNSDV